MAEAKRPEPVDPRQVASLEQTLDRAVDLLTHGEQTSRGRALVIEALRLRDTVGAWRSIAPPPEVRDEVIERVERLAKSAGDATAKDPPAAAPPQPAPPLALPQGNAFPAPLSLGQTVVMPRDIRSDARSAGAPDPGPPQRTVRLSLPAEMSPGPSLEIAGPPSLEVPRRVELPRRGVGDPGGSPPRVEPSPARPLQGNKNIPSLHLDDEASPSYRGGDLERTRTSIPLSELLKPSITVWSLPQPEGLDPNLVMIRDPYSKQADAYRALRRKLGAGTARTIAVTSARTREGKTTCAVNLAFALAEASPRNILVVEANIRAPGLAALMKFEPPRCFTQQLTRDSKDPLDSWVVIEQLPPSATPTPPTPPGAREQGQVPRNNFRSTVHLLAVDARTARLPMLDAVAFSMGIESLKHAGYEYIIIDTPPVLGTMDMSVIGDVVDGILLTSIVKRSTRSTIRAAIEQLKPGPVLGVVVLDT